MKRPVLVRFRQTGFTLVEILVATTLALLLMGAVALMFGRVAESITDSRSMLEAADRLRLAETRLQMDLAGLTATVCPPLKPENNEGYFEYIEGPAISTITIAVNSDNNNQPDPTVGDFDDILMFTTRTTGKPFVGRHQLTGTIQSDVAEVAWFLRGRTLHRRVLLVAPSAFTAASKTGYYTNNDISVHSVDATTVAPNTLGDLTRRECRFAHHSAFLSSDWTWSITTDPSSRVFPTLPTIYECSTATWFSISGSPYSVQNLDLWTNTSGYRVLDNAYATGTRISDDVILTNVIGFDVKAWDPERNDYMDLGHGVAPFSLRGLGHDGQTLSQLAGSPTTARVYDTWSTTYFGDYWADGLDNGAAGSNGIVDDDTEKTNLPPYPIPLRGIQVKIRVFEPDSRQIREVTVVQEFLPR